MNRQISIVTSRCGVSGDDVVAELLEEKEVKRKFLLPDPTGDGDRGAGILRLSLEPHRIGGGQLSIDKPTLTPDECGFYIILSKEFRVDVVANGGIRVYNYNSKSAAYFSNVGEEVAVISPFGRVHKYKEIVTGLSGDKIVKMSPRGVTFTAEGKPIVYLVDAAGCKSTTDKFKYLTGDITSQILLKNQLLGPKGREIIKTVMENIRREFTYEENVQQDLWYIGDFVFTVNATGKLTVRKTNFRFFIAIEPDGQIKVKIDRTTLILRNQFSSFVKFSTESTIMLPEAAASMMVEQSVKIENSRLTAKCVSQHAVLDQKNQLVLCTSK